MRMSRLRESRQFLYELSGAQFVYELYTFRQRRADIDIAQDLADAPGGVQGLVFGQTAIASGLVGPSRLLIGTVSRVRGGAKVAKATKGTKATKKGKKTKARKGISREEYDRMPWYDRVIYDDLADLTDWNPIKASLYIHSGVTLSAIAAYPWWIVYRQLKGKDPFGDKSTGEVWPLLFGNN